MLGFMGWRLWHAGGMASKFGETTQQLLISFEPFYYLLSVSTSNLRSRFSTRYLANSYKSQKVNQLQIGENFL